jgi:hypothetical protein
MGSAVLHTLCRAAAVPYSVQIVDAKCKCAVLLEKAGKRKSRRQIINALFIK